MGTFFVATRPHHRGKSTVMPAPARVILLGASNLTRGLATALETTRAMWGGPLDILAALGHGRSYGIRSRVLVRELPGILTCGLWDAVASRPALPTVALITDVGNDLLYEVPVDRIVEWIEQILDRLLRLDARIVMTRLPVMNVAALPAWQFRLMRALLFPASRLTLETVIEQAFELDERMQALAKSENVRLVACREEWYGFDPIHIKRRRYPRAWRDILATLDDVGSAPAPIGVSFAQRLSLLRVRPERRWVFRVEQYRSQPCHRFDDGTTVSLY